MIPVIRGGIKILDFDIENRPLSYWYDGNPTAEITAIAAAFTDQPKDVRTFLLYPAYDNAQHRKYMTDLLLGFKEMYDQADMVTGHFIRKHDLGIVNAGLVEWGLPTLGEKLTSDTKLDLLRFSQIPKTQENIADMLDLAEKKLHMKQSMWREANRLTIEGIQKTKARVTGDVIQHMKMRKALLKYELLGGPKVWRP